MTPITQALIDRIREAGVLGAHSGLPTHEQLASPVECVLANAASAEPLIRVDGHLVAHHAEDVILGLKLAMQVTGARKGVLVLKRSDEAAIAEATRAIQMDGYAKFHVELQVLPPRYAADAASALVEAFSDGKSALVLEAMTLYHLAQAQRGQRMTRRLVTITGKVNAPKTLWAPIGTPFETLIAAAGGPSEPSEMALLVGGPLTGRLASLEDSLSVTTSTLALLPLDHRLVRRRLIPQKVDVRRAQSTCHSCEACTDLCPVYQQGSSLAPHRVMRALHLPFDARLDVFAATLDCTGCNLCTFYACPVELAPGRLMLEIQARQQNAKTSPARKLPARSRLQVPLGRLAKRLGLYGLDFEAPLDSKELKVSRIALRLTQASDMELVPSVRVGDRVAFAQIVARPTSQSRALPVHTGLAGVVRSLDGAIVIEEIR